MLPVFIMSYGPAGLGVSEPSLIPAIWSRCRQRTGLIASDRVLTAGTTLYQCCLLVDSIVLHITLTSFLIFLVAGVLPHSEQLR